MGGVAVPLSHGIVTRVVNRLIFLLLVNNDNL
jgi:hypothetical protein